ncbi:MAG: hypothetical protein KTR29_11115 [Rhodothermaceae bacterium]|nr:hypothetical protein [Rhodothermaceae bacterium]
MVRRLLFYFFFVVSIIIVPTLDLAAQMPRQRANPSGPVDEVFWAPRVVHLTSVTNLEKNNLDFNIKHTFGVLTNGVEDLFGLDAAANIRFGLDYGITDWLSVGVGRSRFDKLYDGRFKLNALRQKKDGSIPLELAFTGNAAILTVKNGYEVADRLSYMGGVILARKFSDRISLQVTPMFTHFNTVTIERDINDQVVEEINDIVALGIAGRVVLTERVALLVEYIPVLGDRNDQTEDALSVSFDIETGGHVFQLFFTTSQSMTEQHVVARNRDDFLNGDIRFGFNVHRVFSL